MKLTFSQGIVQHSYDGTIPLPGNPNFLDIQAGNVQVDLHASIDQPFQIAYAHRDTHYLVTIRKGTDIKAWGYGSAAVNNAPMNIGSGSGNNSDEFYLWIGLDRITGETKYGWTRYQPTAGASPPSTAINRKNDQHWYDTTTNVMKVWRATGLAPTYGQWTEVIRVFAAKYTVGSSTFTSLSDNSPSFIGTQAGVVAGSSGQVFNVGSLVYDSLSNPLLRTDASNNTVFFTTEDIFLAGLPTGAQARYETFLIDAIGQTPMDAYEMARFSNFNEVIPLVAADQPNALWGIIEQPVTASGDLVQVVLSGVVRNADWSWNNIGEQIYVDRTQPGALIGSGDTNFNGKIIPGQLPIGVAIDYDAILIRRPELSLASTSGVSDHGSLSGLSDDDHHQYHTDARGDARYYRKTQLNANATGSPLLAPTGAKVDKISNSVAGDIVKTDGAGNLITANINIGDVLLNIVEDTTPQLGGDLDVNTHVITGLPAIPSLATEATSKSYVDAKSSAIGGSPAPVLVGDNISLLTNDENYLINIVEDVTPQLGGNLSANTHTITGLPLIPTAATEAVSKSYVDTLSFGGSPLFVGVLAGQGVSILANDVPYVVAGGSPLPLFVGDNVSTLINDANYLINLVEDVTPQLGGDLDVNTHTITGLPTSPSSDSEAISLSYLNARLSGGSPPIVYVGDNVSLLANDANYLINLVEDVTPQLGGDLDVNTHTITGLPTSPSSDSEAISLSYLNARLSGGSPPIVYVGDNVSLLANDANYLINLIEDVTPQLGGDLDVNTHIITGLPAVPTLATEATSKAYVDALAFGGSPSPLFAGDDISKLNNDVPYLINIVEDITPQLGGDLDVNTHAITGLSAVPSISTAATSKLYVDNSISAAILAATSGGSPPILYAGDNISLLANDAGYLLNVLEDTTPQLGGNLDVNTHTITGLPAIPTVASEAASKAYVDTIAFGGSPGLVYVGSNISQLNNNVGYLETVSEDATPSLGGNLNVNTHTIIGLPAIPTVATEATSKAYVDAIAISIGGSPAPILVGDNISLLTNDAGYITSATGGSSTAAGNVTEVQFNAGGSPPAFAASSDFTYDGTKLSVGPGGSPEVDVLALNGNLVLNSQIKANDQDNNRPPYSFASELNTGWYHPDVKTVALAIEGEESFKIVRPGGSPAPSFGSPLPHPADVGIDLYLKNNGDGSSSLRIETDAAARDSFIELITTAGTWAITNDNSGGSGDLLLTPATGGALRIAATGSPSTYTSLVTDPDHIPNKQYVDNAVAVAYSGNLAPGSRTINPTGYTNSTGAPLNLLIRVEDINYPSVVKIDGTTVSSFSSGGGSPVGIEATHSVIVPSGSDYSLTGSGTLLSWYEIQ
jgi:hypothetical protein